MRACDYSLGITLAAILDGWSRACGRRGLHIKLFVKVPHLEVSIEKILDIAIQLADGLDASHGKGIVHRE